MSLIAMSKAFDCPLLAHLHFFIFPKYHCRIQITSVIKSVKSMVQNFVFFDILNSNNANICEKRIFEKELPMTNFRHYKLGLIVQFQHLS